MDTESFCVRMIDTTYHLNSVGVMNTAPGFCIVGYRRIWNICSLQLCPRLQCHAVYALKALESINYIQFDVLS